MNQETNNIMSIFIPYVQVEHDEESIKRAFYDYGIGNVERVDFFVKKGWTMPHKKSAFVHMKHWYYSDITNGIYQELEQDGQWILPISTNEYWILKQMKREKWLQTNYNIHQLAEKVRILENELEQLRTIVSGPLEVLRDDDEPYVKTHTYWC